MTAVDMNGFVASVYLCTRNFHRPRPSLSPCVHLRMCLVFIVAKKRYPEFAEDLVAKVAAPFLSTPGEEEREEKELLRRK